MIGLLSTFYYSDGGGGLMTSRSLIEQRPIPPQFGGLWIRWFKRRRECIDGVEPSLKISRPKQRSRRSLMEALENTSLANNIKKLQDDVEMMGQKTSVHQETLNRIHQSFTEISPAVKFQTARELRLSESC